MAGEPRQAIERLPDRVQTSERDFQRTLLLGLAGDLINPLAQLQIGAAKRLFRRQSAAVPRTASLAMAFDEASFRQLVRWR